VSDDGEIYTTQSGALATSVAKVLGPTAEESRQTLLRLRRRLRWSRGQMAAMLGISIWTLRRWEEGARNPSRAARRLIWIVEGLLFKPERFRDPMGMIVWSEGANISEPQPRAPADSRESCASSVSANAG
jgi:DNA-binding transcriptional regulator YiaG